MNIEFLKNLSNADGIASNEKEVRQAILAELEELPYEKQTDGLGSLIFTKKGKSSKTIAMEKRKIFIVISAQRQLKRLLS